MKKNIVFFTGSGISAESGIPTFRDKADGLWTKYDVSKVASIEGWKEDRESVLEFHADARQMMQKCKANEAHEIIGELEKDFNVTVITQNIDVLHEDGGSTNVLHVHGNINKSKSSLTGEYYKDLEADEEIKIGDKCPKGSQLRYGTVLFGDSLPEEEWVGSVEAIDTADILVVIGTSLQVYPAAGLIERFGGDHVYVINTEVQSIRESDTVTLIYKKATEGMKYLKTLLYE